jgi:hypothetical protein
MSFDDIVDGLIKTTNSVFGKTVVYTCLESGDVTTIKGVFDNAFIDVNNTNSTTPILRIRIADLADEPVQGDTLQIGSTNYTVHNIQPDGQGACTLILEVS